MTIFSLNLIVDAAVSIKFDTCKMRHNEPLLLIYSSHFYFGNCIQILQCVFGSPSNRGTFLKTHTHTHTHPRTPPPHYKSPPTHNCYLVEQCGVIPCGDTPVKHHVSFGIFLWRHFISINVLLRGV